MSCILCSRRDVTVYMLRNRLIFFSSLMYVHKAHNLVLELIVQLASSSEMKASSSLDKDIHPVPTKLVSNYDMIDG